MFIFNTENAGCVAGFVEAFFGRSATGHFSARKCNDSNVPSVFDTFGNGTACKEFNVVGVRSNGY